jgi:hypothetical protein
MSTLSLSEIFISITDLSVRVVIVFPSAKEAENFRQSLYRYKKKLDSLGFLDDQEPTGIFWRTTTAEDGRIQVRFGLTPKKAEVSYTVLLERNNEPSEVSNE